VEILNEETRDMERICQIL